MKLLGGVLGAALLGAIAPAAAWAQSAPAANTPSSAPARYVVAVAPGHGGDDPGAIFPPDSDNPVIEEKNLTLTIALKLRDKLANEGVDVVMTRTSDVTTTAEQRASMAEKAHADAFIAVHVNSYFPDPTVRGAETQFFSDPKLANDLADGLVSSLRTFDETVRTTKNREEDNILSMPGAIVEAAYLSNPADRELLQSDAYQTAVADGIYQGLLQYAPQIQDIKAQTDAYQAAHAPAQPQRSASKAEPASRTRLPGWVPGAALSAGLGLALLAARGRPRRRTRRRPGYATLVRYR
jgi:N-acetylmuramoyl-L-alanine amidase